jgi:hypothetical protein
MSKFSERIGKTKQKVKIQIASMDEDLRNCLWNIFSQLLTKGSPSFGDNRSMVMDDFLKILWRSFFKRPTDTIPSGYNIPYRTLREYFLNQAEWYDVYNFLEFTANLYPTLDSVEWFIIACNSVFEEELSGYRFIGKQIVQMTAKEEILEVEQALVSPVNTVNLHLENAVRLMSNKTSPDYRNSIKESISAVEAVCKLIANNQNATLGHALNIIEREGRITLNSDLKEAFTKLYHYTSDADGIRHALKEETVNATFAEAKFMMVSCSAFVNYLISKASDAGIILSQKN